MGSPLRMRSVVEAGGLAALLLAALLLVPVSAPAAGPECGEATLGGEWPAVDPDWNGTVSVEGAVDKEGSEEAPDDPAALALGYPKGIGLNNKGYPFIANIRKFLDTCPQNDPYTPTIRAGFKIRRNGVIVGDIPCTEPVSQMPVGQYTDELVLLQGLRVAYYMDRGRSGHLPWTAGSLFDWMWYKINGFNIDTSALYNSCCADFGEVLPYVTLIDNDDFQRDFDRKGRGVLDNIALYAHEVRHLDNYPHISCSNPTWADDANYDQGSLTTRGVQWWLYKLWLRGSINVGLSCLADRAESANWFLGGANDGFRDRFCYTKPPLLAMPARPLGRCKPAITDASVANGALVVKGWNFRSDSDILVNGEAQSTDKVKLRLVSREADDGIMPGEAVTLKVLNSDGTVSPKFPWTRP